MQDNVCRIWKKFGIEQHCDQGTVSFCDWLWVQLLPVSFSVWSVLLVSTWISLCSDIIRNICIEPTLLHYITYIFSYFRYSWSYEMCVWWAAKVSRHSADESLQTCISKVDIWTICKLTTITVWFFGCWLWWKYELVVIM